MALLSGIEIDSGTALVLIVFLVAPIAAIAFARSGRAWREIGKGPFAVDREEDGRAMQEAEVRQMVEAKAYLRERRGEPPIDVEAETQRELANLIGSA
jgi:hypothetical protein